MFLGLGTTILLRNRKKYLRILAISLKATCEGVYVLQHPAYIFRDTWRDLLLLTTMIHGLMQLWKWLYFFQGIFQRLPPSCLVVIVTSSMLDYQYLAWETFWMLKILQPLFYYFLSNCIIQSRSWWNVVNTLCMTLSLPYEGKKWLASKFKWANQVWYLWYKILVSCIMKLI